MSEITPTQTREKNFNKNDTARRRGIGAFLTRKLFEREQPQDNEIHKFTLKFDGSTRIAELHIAHQDSQVPEEVFSPAARGRGSVNS